MGKKTRNYTLHDLRDDVGGTTAFCEQLGISRSYGYFLLSGERRPGKDLAVRIEQLSGGRLRKERLVFGDAG